MTQTDGVNVSERGGMVKNTHAVTKRELVHEFPIEYTNQIKRGLCASQKQPIDIVLKDGCYQISEVAKQPMEDRAGYADRLVTQLLTDHRPEKYPPRSSAIWMFSHWPGETQMTRRGAVKLDTTAILDDYTLYAVEFQVADELYMKAIREMEFKGAISADWIESQCEAYWESATTINSVSDLPDTLAEVYLPAKTLPTKYFTAVLTSDDGKEYTHI